MPPILLRAPEEKSACRWCLRKELDASFSDSTGDQYSLLDGEMAHPGDPPTKLKGGRMRDLEDLPHRNLARSRPPTPWSRELYRNRTSGTCTRNASPQNRAMEKGVNRIVESTKEGTDHR